MTKEKQVNRRKRETKRRKKDRGIITNRKKKQTAESMYGAYL